MSHRPSPSSRSALVGLFASLALSACGVGAVPSTSSSRSRVSAAAVDSLVSPVDQGACISGLKGQVYANTLTLEEYEARALSDCGVDFSAPTQGGSGTPEPAPTPPTAEELAYAACATAVKAEVIAGTLDINGYEAALAARCPAPPPAAK